MFFVQVLRLQFPKKNNMTDRKSGVFYAKKTPKGYVLYQFRDLLPRFNILRSPLSEQEKGLSLHPL
jgi:hypothetical protein